MLIMLKYMFLDILLVYKFKRCVDRVQTSMMSPISSTNALTSDIKENKRRV